MTSTWSVQRLAGFLRSESGNTMTLADARRMADALARGPLADVWTEGVEAGRRRAGNKPDERAGDQADTPETSAGTQPAGSI